MKNTDKALGRFGLIPLFIGLVIHVVSGQPKAPSESYIEYKSLPALVNPDALSYKPLPISLAEEGDFRVVRYPVDNPLQLRLLIRNRIGRRWTLKLETDQQELLYFETKRTDWAWQLLNLQDLPTGRYRLVVSAGSHQLTQYFVITRTQPVVDQRMIQF